MSPLLLILELLSLNVPVLLDTLEINLIVDLVGLMELLKLLMIDNVLKLEILPYYLFLIPLDVVLS